MEIYRNSSDRSLALEVPIQAVGDNIDVTIFKDDEAVYSASTVTYTNGRYETVLPFFIVQNEGNYKIHWSFIYQDQGETYEYSEYEEFKVVTPIIPLSLVKQIIENNDDNAARTVEQAVRYIIQAHTGQSFGKFEGKRRVSGSGENNLRLPARLMNLRSVNDGLFYNDLLSIRGNGWFLVGKQRGIPSVRADAYGWHENPYTGDVPIYAPSRGARTLFMEHCEYEIDGTWGWASVPSPVQEAAKLLVNDYACGDSNYRDRFLTSMTAADWRIQFHDGAFSNTGNVRANQLLTEFVLRRGWVVI